MVAASSFAGWHRSNRPAHVAPRLARALAAVALLAACSEPGSLEPLPHAAVGASAAGQATVIVAPNYSAFDVRAEFDAVTVMAHRSDFEEFTGDLVYVQPTPWTTNGVTYTSGLNVVLAPGVGLGVSSNSVSAEFGEPLTGQVPATDTVTAFGADVTIIGEKVPVGLVISTNRASYAFDNLDIPLATVGRRFVGLALSQPGEVITGFRFTVPNRTAAVLLDNVAVGHVGTPNVAPDASAGGPYTGLEGAAVTFGMSATDADDDPLSFSWDLGDGTTGSGATPPAAHTYADDGTYDVLFAVTDGRGGVDTARTTVVVANVAPVLDAFAVPGTAVALTSAGVVVPIAATFRDPGSLDTHAATLDCGTGVASPRLEAAGGGAPNGTVDGTCEFSAAGVYAVRVTVRDDDGASDTEVAAGMVVVYEPSAGFVTGGGWIASPAGAFAAAASVAGKLTFGLVVRYQAGATIPSGNADFKLNLAKLDFRSSAFDWLVISGNTVRLQGRGKVNGVEGYGFAVSGTDGAANDTIRIRIWHLATGATVYDNQGGDPMESDPVQTIGGGSLQVHQR